MTSETGTPRTLAEELRGRPDDALAALLHARPDLLSPVPGDLTQLATRAATRASVTRALERTDRFTLQVAQALAVAPDPCPLPALTALLPGGEDALPGALAALRARALVWGADAQLRLVRTARELLAPSAATPSPTGLGPTLAEAASGMSPGRVQELLAAAGLPATHDAVSGTAALTALFTDRARMAALLARAPADAAALLDRLVWGPPYGTLGSDASGGASPPVRWLLDRGLLMPAGGRVVVLPREAALHLRGGRAHRELEPRAPRVEPHRTHPPATVDATAAGQAFAALGTVEELLTAWEAAPPPVLRAGGLGVRELKRTAAALDRTGPQTAFWVELAYTAGLLASDGEPDERYAPTPAADAWRDAPPQERWAALVTAWRAATRVPGLAGGRDAKGRALAVLGPGLDRTGAPGLRRRVLELLAALPPGAVPDEAAVLARLRWERPLRGTEELRARLCAATLAEAELLGLTGRGALAGYARPLAAAEPDGGGGAGGDGAGGGAEEAAGAGRAGGGRAAEAAAVEAAAGGLAPLLPEPLDHVLLQADLTAVAPGPLRQPLADALAVLADVESKGAATVYRFTPGSVRRALDAGRSAADLHAFLAAHARTPVPQPLTYLIDDVARRHGILRVGGASAYVRCDDDALLAEVMADRRSAPLGLRLLAPTVLAATADPGLLLERLREMGYAPAAESADGDVLITRAAAHRTPPRAAPEPVPDGPPRPDGTLLAAAVRAIRAGDMAATAPHRPHRGGAAPAGGGLPRTAAAETLATMQSAVLTGTAVWIGYVNADGAASQRVIAPVRVEGGFVTAYDHTADEVRTFPLHRVTGVAELADE
ncbi:helicase C-terminal domain-containing protein [Streptomyces sp. TRM 70351]|uniref:helicase C-terminal domain-containing protein n=1 Tax=Streptomyces sp. TRM 70351 TaxID=3116552 RepID=UPI002E7BA871|nr:helicase C-terminal domain-containing protein [Streptomyces sp. TRM 70351]MEE1929629.1 helicase C-terminal domain-containing protein [Streptomyces sp. TRM 70351]